ASPIRLEARSGVLQIKSASLQGAGTNIRLEGSIPLGGEGQFNISSNSTLDLKLLGGFVAGGNSSGQLAVQLQAHGNRANPQIEGQINISNAAFSSDALPVGVEATNGKIAVHGKHLEIENLTGVAGGGQLSASGSADFGSPPTYNFLVKTTS